MDNSYLYIVLTRSNTIISKMIHLVKDDEYTHASISLDRDLKQMYSFGRRYTYYPFLGCFKKEDLNQGIYRLSENIPAVIIELKVTKEQYERARAILYVFIEKGNFYKYNYMGLIHSLSNKAVCTENRFLCSEFVYYILKESGIVDLNMPRNLVRPQNLLDIEGKIIFRGNLKEFELHSTNWLMDEVESNRASAIYR